MRNRNSVHGGFQVSQSSLLGLNDPILGVVVAIKDNPLVICNDFLKESIDLAL
jgi:hypothetical protein